MNIGEVIEALNTFYNVMGKQEFELIFPDTHEHVWGKFTSPEERDVVAFYTHLDNRHKHIMDIAISALMQANKRMSYNGVVPHPMVIVALRLAPGDCEAILLDLLFGNINPVVALQRCARQDLPIEHIAEHLKFMEKALVYFEAKQ